MARHDVQLLCPKADWDNKNFLDVDPDVHKYYLTSLVKGRDWTISSAWAAIKRR